jgi:hypothetical protein
MVKGNDTFKVTLQILRIDQETTQKSIRDIEKLDMVMEQIPTKELYGLQASVMQEVQSRARADATNLEIGREVTEVLQITYDQLTMEKEEENIRAEKLEKGLS